jgi:hypothetical protein
VVLEVVLDIQVEVAEVLVVPVLMVAPQQRHQVVLAHNLLSLEQQLIMPAVVVDLFMTALVVMVAKVVAVVELVRVEPELVGYHQRPQMENMQKVVVVEVLSPEHLATVVPE